MMPSATGELVLYSGLAYLVESFRAGIRSAGQALLDQHAAELDCWYRLLRRGEARPGCPETRRFLAMLDGDVPGPAALARRLAYLENDDLAQEVKVALLQAAYEGRLLTGGYVFTLRDRLLPLLAASPPRVARRPRLKPFRPAPPIRPAPPAPEE
jgi:hypothetical protein